MKSRQILVLSIVVSLVLGFTGGFWLQKLQNPDATSPLSIIRNLINPDQGKPENVDFSLFWKVYNDLNAKYVDKAKINPQKIL